MQKGKRVSGQTEGLPPLLLFFLPPPCSRRSLLPPLQTAFIITINLHRLRRGVMRPARLSTSDSPPRENEVVWGSWVKKKSCRRGAGERDDRREKFWKRNRSQPSMKNAHVHAHLHCTHMYSVVSEVVTIFQLSGFALQSSFSSMSSSSSPSTPVSFCTYITS